MAGKERGKYKMKFNFPETAKTEPGGTENAAALAAEFLPEGLSSFEDWKSDDHEKELQLKAERQAAKEKKTMQMDAREKRERAERFVLLKMGRQMQDNIITAGRIVERVLKAAGDGSPPEEIALLAVKGLALLVNDPMVYTMIEKKYRQQYGITLEAKAPYNLITLPDNEK